RVRAAGVRPGVHAGDLERRLFQRGGQLPGRLLGQVQRADRRPCCVLQRSAAEGTGNGVEVTAGGHPAAIDADQHRGERGGLRVGGGAAFGGGGRGLRGERALDVPVAGGGEPH